MCPAERACSGVFGDNSGILSVYLHETYVVATHQKRLTEALLMSTQNMCFMQKWRKLSKICHQIFFLYKCSALKPILGLRYFRNDFYIKRPLKYQLAILQTYTLSQMNQMIASEEIYKNCQQKNEK